MYILYALVSFSLPPVMVCPVLSKPGQRLLISQFARSRRGSLADTLDPGCLCGNRPHTEAKQTKLRSSCTSPYECRGRRMEGCSGDCRSCPAELLVQSFEHLTFQDKLNLSMTCKAWNELLSNPEVEAAVQPVRRSCTLLLSPAVDLITSAF